MYLTNMVGAQDRFHCTKTCKRPPVLKRTCFKTALSGCLSTVAKQTNIPIKNKQTKQEQKTTTKKQTINTHIR